MREAIMNIPKQLEDLIGADNKAGDEYEDSSIPMQFTEVYVRNALKPELRQKLPKLVKALEDALIEAEKNVAEFFAEGVPYGYTTESWLALARTTFDEDGPTTHPNTLQAEQLKKRKPDA